MRAKLTVRKAVVVAVGAAVLGFGGLGTALATAGGEAPKPEQGQTIEVPEGAETAPAQQLLPPKGDTVEVPEGAETVPAQQIQPSKGDTVELPGGVPAQQVQP